jgi:hypothetical protein
VRRFKKPHQRAELGVGFGDLRGEVLPAAGQAAKRDADRDCRFGPVGAGSGGGQTGGEFGGRQVPQRFADLCRRGDDQAADLIDGLGAGLDRAGPRHAQ